MPSQTPLPFTSRFRLSTVNSRLLCSNSFRFTHFCKNASATPLESHTFKTKDLKPFRITYFQKKGGGRGLFASEHMSPTMARRSPLQVLGDTLPGVMSGASMDNHKRSAGFALTILFAINMMNFFDRNMLAPVVEPIRKEWGLNDAQIGWLATAFTLLYAVVGVPLGRLSDRWNRTRILSLGVALWSLLTAATGIAWNFAALFVARLGVGVGEASCAPASNSLIGDFYPAARRARALSIFMLGLPLGIFFSNLVSGRLAASYGWRFPFFVACVPGLLLAGLALLIPEPQRGAAESSPMPHQPRHSSPYWNVLRIPTMLWIIASGAVSNFMAYAMATFLPAFLSRYHALNLRRSAAIAAVVLGAVGVPGLLLGGWAADRMRRARPNGRLLVSAAALFLAAPCMYLALRW